MQRPLGVWVVLLGYTAYGLLGLGLLAYALTHHDALSLRLQARFGDVEMEDFLWIALLQLVPVIGAMALVMLMRVACYIFALNLVLIVGTTALTVMAELATHTFTFSGYGSTLFAIGIGHAAFNYAWKLTKEGVLG